MSTNTSVYRVDKFNVPKESINEFMNAIKKLHRFLREIPGCLRDLILENNTNDESIEIITILEWLNQESAEKAKNLVKEMQIKENFNPQEIMENNNIQFEISFLKKIVI